jgi:hypothetical protein
MAMTSLKRRLESGTIVYVASAGGRPHGKVWARQVPCERLPLPRDSFRHEAMAMHGGLVDVFTKQQRHRP